LHPQRICQSGEFKAIAIEDEDSWLINRKCVHVEEGIDKSELAVVM
jgi:hypothetical protein